MPDGRALRWIGAGSLLIAVLAVVASLLGLFAPVTYRQETANWRMQAWGQDIGNLLAAAVLLISVYYTRKQSSTGFSVWIGTMFYLLYAYIVYAMAVHFNFLFLVYTTILGLVLYTLIFALSVSRLSPPGETALPAPARVFAAYVLFITGALFMLLWLSEIVPAIATGEVPDSLTEAGLIVNPIHSIDLSTVLPGFILTGVLALRGNRLGLFLLAPWLTFSALMATSIVSAMLILAVNGDSSVILPMSAVLLVVVASLTALWRDLATRA